MQFLRSQQSKGNKDQNIQAAQHNVPVGSIRTVRAAWLSSLRDQASEKGVLRVLLYQFLFNIFIKIVPATEIHL